MNHTTRSQRSPPTGADIRRPSSALRAASFLLLVASVAAADPHYRSSLPQTTSTRWQAVFDDPSLYFYTRAEMPRAYQHAGGFHSPSYNISGDPQQQGKPNGGNWNNEFPWLHPGGTDAAADISRSVKFLRLPKRDDGSPWPVVWWTETLPGGVASSPERGLRWVFPVGTIFGEVLAMRGRDDRLHTWEVRLRERQETGWDIEVLRPFPTFEDLAARLDSAGFPDQAAELRQPREMLPARLRDWQHAGRQVINVVGAIDQLPRLPPDVWQILLDTTRFRPVLGPWREHGEQKCWAPTSDEPTIVPPGYAGTFVGADAESCKHCHDSTLRHGSVHEVRHVGKYGRIVGGDGILSFHPIDPRAISHNGATVPPTMRPEFVRAGMVERFDAGRHPRDRYTLIKGQL